MIQLQYTTILQLSYPELSHLSYDSAEMEHHMFLLGKQMHPGTTNPRGPRTSWARRNDATGQQDVLIRHLRGHQTHGAFGLETWQDWTPVLRHMLSRIFGNYISMIN